MGIYVVTENGLEGYEHRPLTDEKEIEDFVEKNPSLIEKDLYIIGKQVKTDFGKKVDLLGLDKKGNVIVIEFKKEKTPRDVVSQILGYGVWAEGLAIEGLEKIAKEHDKIGDFPSIYKRYEIEVGKIPQPFNENQRWYIVAEKIDPLTKKVASYLREKGIDIDCMEFKFHEKDGKQIVSIDSIFGDDEELSLEDSEEEIDWNDYVDDKGWSEDVVGKIKSFTTEFEDYAKNKGWEPKIALTNGYVALQDVNGKRNYLSLRMRNGKIRLSIRLHEAIQDFEPTLHWYKKGNIWKTDVNKDNLPKIEIFEKLFQKIRGLNKG